MRSHKPFIAFPYSLLILFFSFISFPSIISSTTTLIQQTCKKSSETDPNLTFDFCEASLEEASQVSPRYSSDLRHLGLLAIRLTKLNATRTRRFIEQLVNKSEKLEPYVRACLSDCMELYSDAIQTIKDGVKDYKRKQYDDANFALSSVMDASTTCEDGFHFKRNVVSPLTKRNSDLFQLSAISLSIINMLYVD